MNRNNPTTSDKYETALSAARSAVDRIDEIYIDHLRSLKIIDRAAYNKALLSLKPMLRKKLHAKIAAGSE